MRWMLVIAVVFILMILLTSVISLFRTNHWKSFQHSMRVGQLCKYYPNDSLLVVEILKIDEDEGIVFVLDKSEKLWKVQKSSLYPL